MPYREFIMFASNKTPMHAMTLSQLWIYPVKSLGGIQMNSWTCEQKGFRYDRRWMLLDSKGTFITQRINPKLALFKLHWNQTSFQITYNQHSLTLDPNATPNEAQVRTKVWDDEINVSEMSRDHSAWFSEMLQENVTLVYFPENNTRPVEQQYQVRNEHVSLADAFPYLIIGQASLDDLNSRLKEAVPMNRFRPNLVFTGGEPYEEDTWKNFSIGTKSFVGAKPCARCILITTDQETAKRGAEPLRTLASYRSRNNKTYFGQNVIVLEPGEIKVGDPVSVQSNL